MIHYTALHGQTIKTGSENSGAVSPTEDLPLSESGREQARLLGNRLKKLGFHGKIVSSPYLQTMETAQILAEITETSVIPFAPMRNTFGTDEEAHEYRGIPLKILRERFGRIAPSAQLPYPWWNRLQKLPKRYWPASAAAMTGSVRSIPMRSFSLSDAPHPYRL